MKGHTLEDEDVPRDMTLGRFAAENTFRAEKLPSDQRPLVKNSAGQETASQFFPKQTRNPNEATVDIFQCSSRGVKLAGAVVGEGKQERHAEFTPILQNGEAAREGAVIREGVARRVRKRAAPATGGEEEDGQIYTFCVENTESQVWSDAYAAVVDVIPTPRVWLPRSTIVALLSEEYVSNTLKSYLTRMQQSREPTKEVAYGLNFRRNGSRVEVRYEP